MDWLAPSLLDYGYVERRGRILKLKEIFAREFPRFGSGVVIRLVDLGGRQSPYRPLAQPFDVRWISTDIKSSYPVEIVMDGQAIPFASESIDVLLSTQVLEYVPDLARCADEIYRVLRPGGIAILSTPAVFPPYGDALWRIMPEGWKQLTKRFSERRVDAEVNTVASFFRVTNLYVTILLGGVPVLRDVWRFTFCPLLNLLGYWALPRFHDIGFACNYIVTARK